MVEVIWFVLKDCGEVVIEDGLVVFISIEFRVGSGLRRRNKLGFERGGLVKGFSFVVVVYSCEGVFSVKLGFDWEEFDILGIFVLGLIRVFIFIRYGLVGIWVVLGVG